MLNEVSSWLSGERTSSISMSFRIRSTRWTEAGEGLGGSSEFGMPSAVPGFLTRREAVERYGKRRGVDVSQVPYYYVFGIFKIAVVLQQIYYRYHVGQTKDHRFQGFGQVAELLFWLAKQRSESLTV